MITKFEKYNESLEDEYPYKEYVDLIDLGNRCIPPNDEYPDYRQLEDMIVRKVLLKMCEFKEEQEVIDDKGNFVERVPGKTIKGIIRKVSVESFFDIDCNIKFAIDDGEFKEYDVNPYSGVTVYHKEKPKKPFVDPILDPYGEEEWEF